MERMKNEKGSITLYVLISILFFAVILTATYIAATNNVQNQDDQVAIIKENYEKNIGSEKIVYEFKLKEKNTCYIKEGLMAWLDGTYNSLQEEHKNDLDEWFDLSKHGYYSSIRNSTWLDNSLKVSNKDGIASLLIPYVLKTNQSFTLEFVLEDNDSVKENIYLQSDTDKFIFGEDSYGIYIGEKDNLIKISGNLITNKINYITYTYDHTTGIATVYINDNEGVSKKVSQSKECNLFNSGNVRRSQTYYQIRFYDRVLLNNEIKLNHDIDKYRYQ